MLFEEAYSAPGTLWKSTTFRVCLIPWLLMSLILTNAYIGVAVTDICSPLKLNSVNKFEYLKTTLCKTVCQCAEEFGYNEEIFERFQTALDRREFNPEYHFQWFSKREGNQYLPKGNSKNFQFGDSLSKIINKLVYTVKPRPTKSCGEHPNDIMEHFNLLSTLFTARNYLPDLNDDEHGNNSLSILSGIERQLATCGRVVFVMKSNEVEDEYQFLQNSYKNLTFFKSEESLKSLSIIIINFDGSNIREKIVRVLEAGIYAKIKKNSYRFDFVQRYNNFTRHHSKWFVNRVKPISMFGSVQTIFIIYVMLSLISVGERIIEIMWSTRIKFYNTVCRLMEILWRRIHALWVFLIIRGGVFSICCD